MTHLFNAHLLSTSPSTSTACPSLFLTTYYFTAIPFGAPRRTRTALYHRSVPQIRTVNARENARHRVANRERFAARAGYRLLAHLKPFEH